ncbi:MAG: GvpL/GvpF family gas vesicle protein [Chlorobiaceae bacterium]
MPIDSDRLIYLYCVASEAPLKGASGDHDGIIIMEHNGLFVCLRHVLEDEFSESNLKKNISSEPWLDLHVREHLSVIGNLMERNTVIPFNFGTIYRTRERLQSFLDQHAAGLKSALDYLADKEEWSVKIFCNRAKIVQNISSLSRNIADIDLQISKSSPGKAYILGKKKNEILEKEISQIYNACSKELFSSLNLMAREYRLNQVLSGDLTGRGEDMIVNAAFLIQKDNVPGFIAKTDGLVTEHENMGLLLEVAGPWPPYTFVNLSD